MNKGQICIIILVAIIFFGYTIYSIYFGSEEVKHAEIETLDTVEFSKPIANINKKNTKLAKKAEEKQEEKPSKTWKIHSINLNTATEEELQTVQYIGKKTAPKIIYYREALGGFIDVHQLKDFIFEWQYDKIPIEVFFVDTTQIKKLKIKNITIEQLESHPYIDSRLAKKIINTREIHKLTSIEDFWIYFNADELNKYLINYLDFSQ